VIMIIYDIFYCWDIV